MQCPRLAKILLLIYCPEHRVDMGPSLFPILRQLELSRQVTER